MATKPGYYWAQKLESAANLLGAAEIIRVDNIGRNEYNPVFRIGDATRYSTNEFSIGEKVK